MAAASDTDSPAGQLPSRLRVAVMGAKRVGKTCLLTRIFFNRFKNDYRETLEDFHHPVWKLEDGRKINLDVVDNGGAHAFMRSLGIPLGEAFVLVFSVDDEQSFYAIAGIRAEIASFKGDHDRVPIVVVANKTDLATAKIGEFIKVTRSIVKEEWGHAYVETSAKRNVKVRDIFNELITEYETIQRFKSPTLKIKKKEKIVLNVPKPRCLQSSPPDSENLMRKQKFALSQMDIKAALAKTSETKTEFTKFLTKFSMPKCWVEDRQSARGSRSGSLPNNILESVDYHLDKHRRSSQPSVVSNYRSFKHKFA